MSRFSTVLHIARLVIGMGIKDKKNADSIKKAKQFADVTIDIKHYGLACMEVCTHTHTYKNHFNDTQYLQCWMQTMMVVYAHTGGA